MAVIFENPLILGRFLNFFLFIEKKLLLLLSSIDINDQNFTPFSPFSPLKKEKTKAAVSGGESDTDTNSEGVNGTNGNNNGFAHETGQLRP